MEISTETINLYLSVCQKYSLLVSFMGLIEFNYISHQTIKGGI